MSVIKQRLRAFLLPKADKRFFFRLSCVVGGSILFFGFICRPYVIHGASMHPTYKDGQFILGFKQKYRISELKRGNIVMVELAGSRVMYLKRVVAFPGETVEFRNGKLYIDDKLLDEPYVNGPCDWELPVRQVDPGFVYVIGDNRAMPIDAHRFGAVMRKKINGGPLW